MAAVDKGVVQDQVAEDGLVAAAEQVPLQTVCMVSAQMVA